MGARGDTRSGLWILGTTLVIRERDTNTRIWQAQKFDSVLALTLYCEGNDYDRASSCQQWARNTVTANPALTDVIVACEGDFFSLLALDVDTQNARQAEIGTCLANGGIVSPVADTQSSLPPNVSPIEATASQVVKMNMTVEAQLAATRAP